VLSHQILNIVSELMDLIYPEHPVDSASKLTL